MDLMHDWRRRMLGALAGAVAVPVAVMLTALAVGGGVGGLRSLGQAVTGPKLPAAAPPSDRAGGRDGGDPGRLLARVRRAPRDAAPQRRRAAADAPQRRAAGGMPGGAPSDPVGGVNPPPPDGDAGPPAAPPAPTPGPTPPPQDPPGPVRQVGDAVKEVTDDVPVAGPPAGQVIDALVDTVEALPRVRMP